MIRGRENPIEERETEAAAMKIGDRDEAVEEGYRRHAAWTKHGQLTLRRSPFSVSC
jgi:hypothetical protein